MSNYESFKKFIKNNTILYNILEGINPHVSEAYKECYDTLFTTNQQQNDVVLSYKIDYILTYLHTHLHTGKWDEVSEVLRQAFTAASFIKAAIITIETNGEAKGIKDALKIIDHGFLLGLPVSGNDDLLHKSAAYLSARIEEVANYPLNEEIPCKKLKTDVSNLKIEISKLKARNIDILQTPSLEVFQKDYFMIEKPLIIQGHMNYWPALTKWKDISYILKKAGERTVPIEIGSSYSASNFSQKLMTIREFVEKYYQSSSNGVVGYLAQHDLLSQIPELKEDIRIPDYCCTSRNYEADCVEPEINVWFGPAHTVSSLHNDPKDNFLCQIFGSKQIILYSPDDSKYLYPHDNQLLSNTSRADPLHIDLEQFPDFPNAKMYACRLKAGEMLFIPRKWWHHVISLEKSFSLNFWWQ